MSAAAVIALRRKKLIRRFGEKGATCPEQASLGEGGFDLRFGFCLHPFQDRCKILGGALRQSSQRQPAQLPRRIDVGGLWTQPALNCNEAAQSRSFFGLWLLLSGNGTSSCWSVSSALPAARFPLAFAKVLLSPDGPGVEQAWRKDGAGPGEESVRRFPE